MKQLLVLILALSMIACGAKESASPDGEKAQPATSSSPATETSAAANVGAMMPAYSATLLDGAPFDLAKRHGKVVLLNVWATWCGPCRFEIPELEKIHRQYSARGFEVIGVSVDEGGREEVRGFVEDQKMTYPIVLDPSGRITTLLDTSVLPTSVLIDSRGRIIWKKYGLIPENDQELLKAIEGALPKV